MNSELIDIKGEWFKAVENHIIPLGFEETVYGYARVRTVRQPGQTIIINGQPMQQPGKEIEIRQDIYLDGDGWVADVNESNKVEFTQVRFEAYQGDNLTTQYEEAFYWNNPEYFINFFNQVFG